MSALPRIILKLSNGEKPVTPEEAIDHLNKRQISPFTLYRFENETTYEMISGLERHLADSSRGSVEATEKSLIHQSATPERADWKPEDRPPSRSDQDGEVALSPQIEFETCAAHATGIPAARKKGGRWAFIIMTVMIAVSAAALFIFPRRSPIVPPRTGTRLATPISRQSDLQAAAPQPKKDIQGNPTRNREIPGKRVQPGVDSSAGLPGDYSLGRHDDISPEEARRHNDRGIALIKENRYNDAIEEFKIAAAGSPTNAEYWNNIGFGYQKIERWEVSNFFCLEALRLDPKRAVAHGNIAYNFVKLGRSEEAIPYWDSYYRLLKTGAQRDRALRFMRSLKDQDPDPRVRGSLRIALERLGQTP